MSLSFLNPGLLWGLLAAAIPVAIHLFFRRRPRPTPFPAIDFILKAHRETERRLRLKKILLFAARTALLAAIALALTRPRAEKPGEAAAAVIQGPRATAIVLDASGSMAYRLGDRSLFERARADALSALAGLGTDEPATAVVCGGEPPAAEAPSFDRASVRRVLERAQLFPGHSDMTACVGVALRALTDAKAQQILGKRIVVATDLTATAWRLDVPPPLVDTPTGKVRPEVEVVDAARGAALPNVAVTDLAAEPDPAVGPRGYRITATLANSGAAPLKDLSLQLRTGAGKDAKGVLRAFADLPAGGQTRKQLSYAFPAGGPAVLTVAVPEDPLPIDDARSLAVVVPREVRALVVDGSPSPVKYRDEAYFVESALASPASPVRPTRIDAEALAQQDLSGFDVVFLLNVRSVGAKVADLQKFVERGGGLFISLGDQVDPDAYDRELAGLLPLPLHLVKTAAERGAPGSEARAARFAEVNVQHPALSIFTGEAREGLVGTRTFRYVLTKPADAKRGPAPHVLAAFDDGAPALVEGRRGQGRILLFTSTADRDWTDWPIRTSYLPAMQRFAAWLAGGLEERHDPPTVIGSPRKLRLEEGEALAAIVPPDGRERRGSELEALVDEAENGGLVVHPREPGLWQVKVKARGQERVEPRLAFAVWPDPRESDTRRLDPQELTAYFGGAEHAKIDGQSGGPSAGRAVPLWSILLVVGLAAFFAEGLLVA